MNCALQCKNAKQGLIRPGNLRALCWAIPASFADGMWMDARRKARRNTWLGEFMSRRLYVAVARGQTRIFNRLLVEGANPNWKTEDRSTPLHVTVQQGHPSEFVLGLIRAGADIGATDARGRTALDVVLEQTALTPRPSLVALASLACHLIRWPDSAEAEASSQMVAEFEGIAVVHPGEELGLAAVPRVQPIQPAARSRHFGLTGAVAEAFTLVHAAWSLHERARSRKALSPLSVKADC